MSDVILVPAGSTTKSAPPNPLSRVTSSVVEFVLFDRRAVYALAAVAAYFLLRGARR